MEHLLRKSPSVVMFDFDIFKRIVIKEYKAIGKHPYTIDEVLAIFKYYFNSYQLYMGKEHHYLKPEQIRRIIEEMPQCDDFDFEPQDYETLIDSYFETDFYSDRNINHFFSGQIRELRYYEKLY